MPVFMFNIYLPVLGNEFGTKNLLLMPLFLFIYVLYWPSIFATEPVDELLLVDEDPDIADVFLSEVVKVEEDASPDDGELCEDEVAE